MDVINLGYCDYEIALRKQYEILKKVQDGEKNDTLILVEHPTVIILGMNADENNVLFSEKMLNREGITLERTNRGGDATYHGPGQIVGYPYLI